MDDLRSLFSSLGGYHRSWSIHRTNQGVKTMPKISASTSSFVHRLKGVLADSLTAAGLDTEVRTEPVRLTKLYRVLVVSKQFKHMRPSERQDLVWRIVGDKLTQQEQLRISMIL